MLETLLLVFGLKQNCPILTIKGNTTIEHLIPFATKLLLPIFQAICPLLQVSHLLQKGSRICK